MAAELKLQGPAAETQPGLFSGLVSQMGLFHLAARPVLRDEGDMSLLPKPLRVATWNVNSVRLRAEQVARFVSDQAPDLVCLQEIKCREGEFPAQAFIDMGLPHLRIAGQKGSHGVAIASRLPLEDAPPLDVCREGHARCVGAMIEGVEIHNFYIPAGGDTPDRAVNPKFDHKLDFYEKLTAEMARRDPKAPLLMVGDLNIAPGENDVWNHKYMLKVVSHTPVELEAMAALKASLGFVDLVRQAIPEPQKLFSWWSYRAADFRASNRGPAAGPRLGLAGAGETLHRRGAGARHGARMGEALGPCADDGGSGGRKHLASYGLQVSRFGVVEQRAVSRHQPATEMARGRRDNPVGGVPQRSRWEEGRPDQKMIQDQKTLQDTAFQKQQKVKSLQEQRDNLRTDSPQYGDKDKELQTAKIDLEVWAQIQQAESARTNKMQTKALFDKIVNAVAEVATAKGIDLVIADQHPEVPDNFMEQATLEQVRALLGQRNVLYSSPQVDITQDVITALDAKYAAGK